jgi:hypothetical protein
LTVGTGVGVGLGVADGVDDGVGLEEDEELAVGLGLEDG